MGEQLQHYGVPGMKWGVRKDQADRNVATYRSDIDGRARAKQGKKLDYDRLSTKEVNLGRRFNRVSGSKESSSKGTTYVTNNEEDHDRYKALLSPGHGTSDVKYDTRISTAGDLVSPSEKKRVDTLIATVGEQVADPRSGQVVLGRRYLEADRSDRKLSDRDLVLKRYDLFAQTQGSRSQLHEAYFKKIAGQGYHALLDDADRGLVSKSPIILLGQDLVRSVDSSRRLTEEDIIDAQIRMKRL